MSDESEGEANEKWKHKAAKETLIITDGFSCREQIAQATDRQALHLAQVIQMALHEDSDGLARAHPGVEYVARAAQQMSSRPGVAMLIGGALIWLLRRGRGR